MKNLLWLLLLSLVFSCNVPSSDDNTTTLSGIIENSPTDYVVLYNPEISDTTSIDETVHFCLNFSLTAPIILP